MGDIETYNGGAIMAMRGRDCVAIASDHRIGIQYSTEAMNESARIQELSPYTFVALTGLLSDVHTVQNILRFRNNLYTLDEGRYLQPKQCTKMLSHLLYEHRFGPYFVSPIVAGLYEADAEEEEDLSGSESIDENENENTKDSNATLTAEPSNATVTADDKYISNGSSEPLLLEEKKIVFEKERKEEFAKIKKSASKKVLKPFVASMDSIGAISDHDNWYTDGTAGEMLCGPCEAYYRDDMTESELLETVEKCFTSGVNRDALSGWGFTIYVLTPNGVKIKEVLGRQD